MTQKAILSKLSSEDGFNFQEFEKAAIEQLKHGAPLTGAGGILAPFIKKIVEASLEGEMDAHLADCATTGRSNRRNGKGRKTVKTGSRSLGRCLHEQPVLSK